MTTSDTGDVDPASTQHPDQDQDQTDAWLNHLKDANVKVGSRTLRAKVGYRDGEQVIVSAVVPGDHPEQPLGLVQIGRIDGSAWMASTGSGWIDQDFPTIEDAVDWVAAYAAATPDDWHA